MTRTALAVLVAASASAAPWPGEPAAQAVDLTSLVPGTAAGFGQQVSDLFWNPLTRTLWVARAPGGVWALTEADGGFRVAASYPAISGDYEGITQASLSDPAVYVLDETAGVIRKFAVDGAGGSTLVRAWSLAGVVPPQVGNAGPEGLAFVPDESLSAAGFPTSARDAGGLFFVAHQNGGQVYAIDLDPADSAGRTLIARLPTSRTESSALAFDRSSGRLYVSHNTGSNFLEVDRLGLAADGGPTLERVSELDSPNTSNLEGFALTPQYAADGGAPAERWCFWADDDGNSVGRPGVMWFRQLPPALSIAAGNAQAAGPLAAVPVAPAITLRDAFSNEYAGQRIAFAATGGNGTVTGATPLTTAAGIGTVGAWILGASGAQQLTATAPDFTAPPVIFTATLLAVAVDAGSIVDAGAIVDAGSSTDAGSQPDGGEDPLGPPVGCGCGAAPAGWAVLALLMAARGRRRR